MLIRKHELDDDKRKKKKRKRYGEAGEFTYAIELPPDQHPNLHATHLYFSIVGYGDQNSR